jgi:hypothetical protein
MIKKNCSPARNFAAEAVLELDGGEVPVTNGGEVPASGDGDGVADEVRTMTAVSKT